MELSVLNGRHVETTPRSRNSAFGPESNERRRTTEIGYSDGGPHREMAVDCPANFIGVKKEPPRLPRPLSSVVDSRSPAGRNTGSSTPQHAPSFTASDSKTLASKSAFDRDERDRSERLRRYQEELAKRRELEDRFNQQQEQLRASLRGSKKMQNLEERRARERSAETGFVNPNYHVDDDDSITKSERKRFGADRAQIVTPLNVQDFVTSLQRARNFLHSSENQADLNHVYQFVSCERFQRALALYNKLVSAVLQVGQPPSNQISALDLCDELRQSAGLAGQYDKHAVDLKKILGDPHFKSLMYAHDECLRHCSMSKNTDKSVEDADERQYLYERASQYGDDNIKIVRLQKTADPLGATVRNEGESVIVGRIMKGGVAEKSGLIHEGDEILEINGVGVRGMTINDVCDHMSRLVGVLTFLINPGPEHIERISPDTEMHIRALFNYDPEEDNLIPCREIGIMFSRGDILHVINQEDASWWQAYRDGEEDQTLAGLIPSKHFHEQRERIKRAAFNDKKSKSNNKCHCDCGKPLHRRRKKRSQLGDDSDTDAEEILSYEEVIQYYPQPNRKRPIVLIGPPSVGRQELRQRLMESNPDRFAAAIPHTTRPPTGNERNGLDYHFVSKDAFMADIADGRFVEYGEYGKHLYGTSLDAIRQVVNSGRICILNFHPQSMVILKMSDLKPYFIFIAPGSIAKLKQIRQKQGDNVSDEELQKTIDKGREMENDFGHYFDMVIVNQDIDRAYTDLLAEINRLEVEAQWVPVQWLA